MRRTRASDLSTGIAVRCTDEKLSRGRLRRDLRPVARSTRRKRARPKALDFNRKTYCRLTANVGNRIIRGGPAIPSPVMQQHIAVTLHGRANDEKALRPLFARA